jgi:translation initiation factor IF-3
MDGHKVQIVQNFRGREMVHRQRGYDRMKDIVEQLSDIAKLEVAPRQTGRRMTMMLAPDKAKIEQIKRRDSKDEKGDTTQQKEKKDETSSDKSAEAKTTDAPPKDASQPAATESKADDSTRESLEAAHTE